MEAKLPIWEGNRRSGFMMWKICISTRSHG